MERNYKSEIESFEHREKYDEYLDGLHQGVPYFSYSYILRELDPLGYIVGYSDFEDCLDEE
ncbi:MAG TPA: hypothetical protein VMX17_01955 [Candidatus Glassbacteria bacterium]|jgi:hypothetical protein|nr:hypothetical protein [Candidatus Glassbacteria bacterium]